MRPLTLGMGWLGWGAVCTLQAVNSRSNISPQLAIDNSSHSHTSRWHFLLPLMTPSLSWIPHGCHWHLRTSHQVTMLWISSALVAAGWGYRTRGPSSSKCFKCVHVWKCVLLLKIPWGMVYTRRVSSKELFVWLSELVYKWDWMLLLHIIATSIRSITPLIHIFHNEKSKLETGKRDWR